MSQLLLKWLSAHDIAHAVLLTNLAMVLSILVIIALIHYVSRFFIHRLLTLNAVARRPRLVSALKEFKLLSRLVLLLQGVIVIAQAKLWLLPGQMQKVIILAAVLWCMFIIILLIFAALNILHMMWTASSRSQLPLRGLLQTAKLIVAVVMGLLMVSVVLGKSPMLLLSGLGAMSAVLMLVFKDPILGLVAGIQLASNDMVKIGDWLQMDKYGADGDVIDIGLTTVKVRNFDNTITTLPTYALVSEAFRNWNAMTESGGRRIKRAVLIDAASVHFLSAEEEEKLRNSNLLQSYLSHKSEELGEHNKTYIENQLCSYLDGRHLTNIGTFRAYLSAYLNRHPNVHRHMTCMVRQLQPEDRGIPLEVYCFTNDVRWAYYENIQADIFDHIYAVIDEFNLSIYQAPSGSDLRELSGQLGGYGPTHYDAVNDTAKG